MAVNPNTQANPPQSSLQQTMQRQQQQFAQQQQRDRMGSAQAGMGGQYNPNQQAIGPYNPPQMGTGPQMPGNLGGVGNLRPQGGYTPTPMPGAWNPQIPQAGGYGAPNAGYTPFPGNPMPAPQMPPNFGQLGGETPAPHPNRFGDQGGQGGGNSGRAPWGGFGYTMPGNFGEGDWERKGVRDFVLAMQPYMQMEQNAYQWGQEFGEGNRRWNDQFGWTRQGDTFNMGLAGRQQQMAEWQAQEMANQWGAQFGREGVRDEREWDMANRRFGLDEKLGMGDLGVKQQANTIDQMWKSGQLTNQQRELALAELTQGQKFGLDTRTQASLEQYRNAQLAQDERLRREEMANQQQIANMQAYGRTQAPNMRWARSW